ncbi:unnamed protein product, partial [Dovyalis caffra]
HHHYTSSLIPSHVSPNNTTARPKNTPTAPPNELTQHLSHSPHNHTPASLSFSPSSASSPNTNCHAASQNTSPPTSPNELNLVLDFSNYTLD